MKKKTLSMAVLGAMLTFGVAGQAQAASTIVFDPTGGAGSGGFNVDTFDWLPSSALAVNALDATKADGTLNSAFTLFTHASLSQFVKGGTAVSGTGLGSDYELTFVSGFGEKLTGASAFPGAATFAFDSSNTTTNFFEIYIDTKKNSDNSIDDGNPGGTGFNDTHLASPILRGRVTDSNDAFAVYAAPPTGGNYLDNFNIQHGPSTVLGVGGGATSILSLVVDYIDTNYFPTGTPGLSISFTTNFVTPFNQVDPANRFWDKPNLSYLTPSLGPINGITGPDFEFQVDANQSFQPVPEPASMILLGTGLMSIAGISRKRRQKQTTA